MSESFTRWYSHEGSVTGWHRGTENQQRLAALGQGTKQELRNQRWVCERSRGAGHARGVAIPHSHLPDSSQLKEDVSKQKGGSPCSQSCLEIIKGHSQSCFCAFKLNVVLLKGGLGSWPQSLCFWWAQEQHR